MFDFLGIVETVVEYAFLLISLIAYLACTIACLAMILAWVVVTRR